MSFGVPAPYFYVKRVLLAQAATVANFALFFGVLVLELAVLIVLCRLASGRRALLRRIAFAVGAAAIAGTVFSGLPVEVLLFGYALLLMLASGIFKTAIGAAGGILFAYGLRANSMDMMVSGLTVNLICSKELHRCYHFLTKTCCCCC